MRPARWPAAIVALFVSAAIVAGCGDEPPYPDDSGGWFTITDATNNYREFRCYSNHGTGLWCYAKETP